MFPIRDHNPSSKLPVITLLLIGMNAVAFFIELRSPNLDAFLQQYALVPALVDFSHPATLWPFLTSMFLHGGWLHILSNMWFLWIFGDNVEATLGHFKYLAFYIICGLAAAILQFTVTPGSEIPMLGASGAIAGVLGGYLVLFPQSQIETLVTSFGGYLRTINVPASFMLLYWFGTQLFAGVGSIAVGMHESGGVAFFAHIGGFAAGWIIMKVVSPQVTWRRIE